MKTREPHGQTLRQSNSNSFTVFSFQWLRALLDQQCITGRPFDFGRRIDSPRATLRFSRFSRFSRNTLKIVKIVKGESRNFRKLSCGRHRVGVDTLPYQFTFGNGPRNPTKRISIPTLDFSDFRAGRPGPRLPGQLCLLH